MTNYKIESLDIATEFETKDAEEFLNMLEETEDEALGCNYDVELTIAIDDEEFFATIANHMVLLDGEIVTTLANYFADVFADVGVYGATGYAVYF